MCNDGVVVMHDAGARWTSKKKILEENEERILSDLNAG